MRIVHFNIDAWVWGDIRMRKVLQWHQRRGFDDVYTVAGFYGLPQDNRKLQVLPIRVEDSVGMAAFREAENPETIDGYPLWHINSYFKERTQDILMRHFRPDVIHVHELDALWALMTRWHGESNYEWAKDCIESGLCTVEKPKGVRIIYEAHEYERGRIPPHWPKELAEDRAYRESILIPLVDEMIVVSPAIQKRTEADLGVSPHLIPNSPYAYQRTRDGRLRKQMKVRPEERLVVFCGNVTLGRGLMTIARAMRLLGKQWRLAILGAATWIDQDLKNDLGRIGAWLMEPKGYPHPGEDDAFIDWISDGDVGVNIMDMRVDNCRLALPNKFFEYAWARVPQVHNRQIDVENLTRDYNLGLCVDVSGDESDPGPMEAERIAEAIEVLYETSAPSRWDEFMADWCWENTGGAVIDELYGDGKTRVAI